MKKFLILFLFAGFLWSCSSDDDNGGGDTPDNTAMIPIKVSMAGEEGVYEVRYFYNGNKLSRISYSANSPLGDVEMLVQYEGDKISQMSAILDDTELKKTYTYENNRIASITNLFDDAVTSQKSYEWISDEKVRVTTSANSDYYTTFHISDGNIVKVEDYFGGNVWENIYTYDNKNSPFKNVEGFKYIIEDGDSSFNRNNILKDVMTAGGEHMSTTTYSYTYNDAGYPTVYTMTSEDGDTTLNITYRE